ncbi:MAG: hypothetical protein Q7T11_09335 [Deltaproteobacteria bacterium]|nr:hypothetical protein [Deltaproteobacteria bacterium]
MGDDKVSNPPQCSGISSLLTIPALQDLGIQTVDQGSTRKQLDPKDTFILSSGEGGKTTVNFDLMLRGLWETARSKIFSVACRYPDEETFRIDVVRHFDIQARTVFEAAQILAGQSLPQDKPNIYRPAITGLKNACDLSKNLSESHQVEFEPTCNLADLMTEQYPVR